MKVKEDLQDIIKKMQNIYENINSIQYKNEEINRTIENMVGEEYQEKNKKTKVMPTAYIF